MNNYEDQHFTAEIVSGPNDPMRPGPNSPPPSSPGGGWIIAIILGLISILALVFLILGLAVYQFSKYNSAKPVANHVSEHYSPGVVTTTIDQRIEVDLAAARESRSSRQDVASHPEFQRIDQFMIKMNSTLDDSFNVAAESFVDIERYSDIIVERLVELGNSRRDCDGLAKLLESQTSGPTPFISYELTGIRHIRDNDYQLFIEMNTGYRNEPVIWWVSLEEDRIRLYDWVQLELGIRETDERAVVFDETASGDEQYGMYADLSIQYVSIDQTMDYYERSARVQSILKGMELLRLPSDMTPSSNLIIAKRWKLEGELDAALGVLVKTKDKHLAPGIYKLIAEIYVEQENYTLAIQNYKSFISRLGADRVSLIPLAACYKAKGDIKNEKRTLEDAIRMIMVHEGHIALRLISLCSDAELESVIATIQAHHDGDQLLDSMISQAASLPYYRKELRRISEFFLSSDPDSNLAIRSQFFASSGDLKDAGSFLQSIPAGESGANLRYSFWDQLTKDPKMLLTTFENSEASMEDYEAISDVDEYNARLDSDTMVKIAEIALKKHSEEFLPHRDRAYAYMGDGKYGLAIEDLKRAIEKHARQTEVPEEEDYTLKGLRNSLLVSYYKDGQKELASKYAIEQQSIQQLISLAQDDDQLDIEPLLDQIEGDDGFVSRQRAMLKFDRGQKQQAITALSKLLEGANGEEFENIGLQTELMDMCQEIGSPFKFVELAPSKKRFGAFFRNQILRRNWDECASGLRKAREFMKPTELSRYRIELHWEKQEYQNVCDNAAQRAMFGGDYRARQLFEYVVRSAIRAGDFNLAATVAREAQKKFSDERLLAIVSLVQGNDQQAAQSIAAMEEYSRRGIFDDVDVGKLAIEKRVAGKLGEFEPISFVSVKSGTKIQFLRDTAFGDDIEGLFSKHLETIFQQKPSSLKQLENQDPKVSAWHCAVGDYQIWLTELAIVAPVKDTLTPQQKTVGLDRVSHRVTVEVHKKKTTEEDDSKQRVYELGARLLGNKFLAWGEYYSWKAANDLLDESGKLKPEAWQNPTYGDSGWTFIPETDSFEFEDIKFEDQLVEASRRFELGDSNQFEITIRYSVGYAVHRLAMQVESVEVGPYGYMSFIGPLEPKDEFDLGTHSKVNYSVPLDVVERFSLTGKDGATTNASANFGR